jgi:hypothetical protein
MKAIVRDEIDSAAAALERIAADLRDNQDKLLLHARSLEAKISERESELNAENEFLQSSATEAETYSIASDDQTY